MVDLVQGMQCLVVGKARKSIDLGWSGERMYCGLEVVTAAGVVAVVDEVVIDRGCLQWFNVAGSRCRGGRAMGWKNGTAAGASIAVVEGDGGSSRIVVWWCRFLMSCCLILIPQFLSVLLVYCC